MKKINRLFLSALVVLLFQSAIMKSQVSVVNIQLLPYNITPESMMAAAIMNTDNEQQVQIISKLFNFNSELLLTVKSSPFNLKHGLNSAIDPGRRASSVEYSSSKQANYIQTTHGLPSGTFKICIDIIYTKTSETGDQFCDEIESDFNQYLYLVYPADKEVIETKNPMLTWTHSEPFSILTSGEYFRMIVVEKKDKQSSQEAVDMNPPLMVKNYLTVHNLQYPYDAKELEEGKTYAWQVQKMANSVTIEKTEAWEFKIKSPDLPSPPQYTILKKILDGSFYQVKNDKIFFRFQEEYNSGKLSCTIYNSKREAMTAEASNEKEKKEVLNYKQQGFNEFEVDLDGYKLTQGFYTLEVKNSRNELFLLKFYIK